MADNRNKTDRIAVARAGEELAASFLQEKGLVITERNWRSGRFGEIDIVARNQNGLLVFVEVKTRKQSQPQPGFPAAGFEKVNWDKRRKLTLCAMSYIARKRVPTPACRIDVIVITYETLEELLCGKVKNLMHVEGAITV